MATYASYTLFALVAHPNASERKRVGLWMNDRHRFIHAVYMQLFINLLAIHIGHNITQKY